MLRIFKSEITTELLTVTAADNTQCLLLTLGSNGFDGCDALLQRLSLRCTAALFQVSSTESSRIQPSDITYHDEWPRSFCICCCRFQGFGSCWVQLWCAAQPCCWVGTKSGNMTSSNSSTSCSWKAVRLKMSRMNVKQTLGLDTLKLMTS